MIRVEIGINEQSQRLDKFLRKYLENAPLSYIYRSIRKDIKVNGKRCKEDTMLNLGDEVTLYISDEDIKKFKKSERAVSAKRQFKVAYEDDNIIVVEKPFGLLTHGDRFEKKNHLANQVVDYLIQKGDYNPRIEKTFTPASVNRLDRNTTGLVLFGKNNLSLQLLNQMIREKDKISKYYMTIVSGKLRNELHLQDKMTKDCKNNMVTVLPTNGEGKTMETYVRPIMRTQRYSLVEVEIITGRTHQIRAHLAKAGYPVIGDVKYGDKRVNGIMRDRFNLNTQLLHAYKLKFEGCTGILEYLNGIEIIADIPHEFNRIKEEIFEHN